VASVVVVAVGEFAGELRKGISVLRDHRNIAGIVKFMRVAKTAANLYGRKVRADAIAFSHGACELQVKLRASAMVHLNVIQSVV
jgi:hypothetical protein